MSESVGVFIKMMTRCLMTLSRVSPTFGEPSIELVLPKLHAYNGFISIEGPLNGWLGLSFPKEFTDDLLCFVSEPSRDEEIRIDMAGEIANTVAANSREHFGKRLIIHPPLATGNGMIDPSLIESSMFLKIPFKWHGHPAILLISLYS
ncbi:MAG: chemotaxis protein CheX [Luteolibacter sp.]